MKSHSLISLVFSAILVDTLIGYYLLLSNRGGKYIREWYNQFTIGAYLMDVLSIVVGTFLATKISSNIYYQILAVVIIGLIHDTTFGYFINKIQSESKIINLFKNYANENGINILIVDAIMLVATLLFSNYFYKLYPSVIISFLSIITTYIGLFMIYSF
jgi:accessory gene regulator protein AgrB